MRDTQLRLLALVACLALAGCSGGGSGGSSPVAAAAAVTPGSTGGTTGGATTPPAPAGPRPLRAEGRFLRDRLDRAVILRGLNVAQATKTAPYLPWQSEADMDRFLDWGFNVARLGIQWRAVEPDPGRIDHAYLDAVAERVRWLSSRGVYVIVDMHQDIYGGPYRGNGAPDWACLVPAIVPPNVLSGLPWFAHYGKPEVMWAFDQFWANAAAPDGVGLQDHYAAAWAAVARRFRGDVAVAGYELFNEPYYGSDVLDLVQAAVSHDPLAIFRIDQLDHPSVLEPMLNAMRGPQADFEIQKLAPFYDRVIAAIRAEDPDHVIFLEPAGLANAGIPSSLPKPVAPDIAYSPHYYDPQCRDGQAPYDGNAGRMQAAIGRHASRWDAPMILGEFGAIPSGLAGANEYIQDVYATLDSSWSGSAWWDWGRGLASHSALGSLVRAQPRAVPGLPVATTFDPATGTLEIRYQTQPSDTAPLEISLPAMHFPSGYQVTSSDPAGTWASVFEAATNVLAVTHDRSTPLHVVTVTPR